MKIADIEKQDQVGEKFFLLYQKYGELESVILIFYKLRMVLVFERGGSVEKAEDFLLCISKIILRFSYNEITQESETNLMEDFYVLNSIYDEMVYEIEGNGYIRDLDENSIYEKVIFSGDYSTVQDYNIFDAISLAKKRFFQS